MLCEICKKNQATFFYKQTKNGVTFEKNLCSSCAKEQGLTANYGLFDFDGIASDDFFGGLFGSFAAGQPKIVAAQKCEKCGMTLGRAYGKELTEEQVKDLLEGKKIYVEGLKSKKGGTYNAYLTPDGVQEYSYTKKDGTEFNGFQYKFNMEFPKKEDK